MEFGQRSWSRCKFARLNFSLNQNQGLDWDFSLIQGLHANLAFSRNLGIVFGIGNRWTGRIGHGPRQ
jgi:hypothetical protein